MQFLHLNLHTKFSRIKMKSKYKIEQLCRKCWDCKLLVVFAVGWFIPHSRVGGIHLEANNNHRFLNKWRGSAKSAGAQIPLKTLSHACKFHREYKGELTCWKSWNKKKFKLDCKTISASFGVLSGVVSNTVVNDFVFGEIMHFICLEKIVLWIWATRRRSFRLQLKITLLMQRMPL